MVQFWWECIAAGSCGDGGDRRMRDHILTAGMKQGEQAVSMSKLCTLKASLNDMLSHARMHILNLP